MSSSWLLSAATAATADGLMRESDGCGRLGKARPDWFRSGVGPSGCCLLPTLVAYTKMGWGYS